MRRRTDKKQKNRGFTLVEMIVTVAIIAVFSGVVLTAVTAGARMYRNVSSSTRVQVDAQQLADDMENLIIDANKGVYYAYGRGSALGTAITDDIDSGTAGDRTLLVCNQCQDENGSTYLKVEALDFVEAEETVYYSSWRQGGTASVERFVYAEAIKSFRVDVSQVVSGHTLRFSLTTEKNGKQINTLHTVNLRNQIKVAEPGSL